MSPQLMLTFDNFFQTFTYIVAPCFTDIKCKFLQEIYCRGLVEFVSENEELEMRTCQNWKIAR